VAWLPASVLLVMVTLPRSPLKMAPPWPQEKDLGPAQRAASSTRSPQELIEIVIAAISARFGQSYIGLGDHGIRSAGGRYLKHWTSFHQL